MRARWIAVVGMTTLMSTVTAVSARADEGVRYVDEIFDEVEVTYDITYGEAYNSLGELQQLQLDLFKPVGDDATDRGLIIWAHGSGFRFGNKSSSGPVADYVHRGWVGISMAYRMRPELPANVFVGIVLDPTSVIAAQAAARDAQHDMQAVVRWARFHADDLGIDPERIAVGGISAGGIIALMTAFNANDPGDSGTPGVSSHVAAAVSHAGAYVPVLQGAFPQPGAPPVAIYHGTFDEQVPWPTSPPGCLLTIAVGNTCEYVTFVGANHTTLGVPLAQDFLYRQVIVNAPGVQVPLTYTQDDDITILAGIEQIVGELGIALGIEIPTDPQEYVDNLNYFLEYLLGAVGL